MCMMLLMDINANNLFGLTKWSPDYPPLWTFKQTVCQPSTNLGRNNRLTAISECLLIFALLRFQRELLGQFLVSG
jgi:hypothetical protein